MVEVSVGDTVQALMAADLVSASRLILLHGHAGGVIDAFGNFVVGGSYVVGIVIFFALGARGGVNASTPPSRYARSQSPTVEYRRMSNLAAVWLMESRFSHMCCRTDSLKSAEYRLLFLLSPASPWSR